MENAESIRKKKMTRRNIDIKRKEKKRNKILEKKKGKEKERNGN